MATLAADTPFEVVSENKQSGAALTGEAFTTVAPVGIPKTNCTHQKHGGGPASVQPVRLCTVALASYPSKNIFTLASVQSQQTLWVSFSFFFFLSSI